MVTLCIYAFIYLPLISKLQILIETFDNMDLRPIIRQYKHLRDPNFTLYSGVLTIKLSYNKTLKYFLLHVTVKAYLIELCYLLHFISEVKEEGKRRL